MASDIELIENESQAFEFIKSKLNDENFTDNQIYIKERKIVDLRTKNVQVVLKIKNDYVNEQLFNQYVRSSNENAKIIQSSYVLENNTEKEFFVFEFVIKL